MCSDVSYAINHVILRTSQTIRVNTPSGGPFLIRPSSTIKSPRRAGYLQLHLISILLAYAGHHKVTKVTIKVKWSLQRVTFISCYGML